MDVHEDTRENPGNRPGIVDQDQGPDMSENMVVDYSSELNQLVTDKVALEKYYDQVVSAGRDGLDPIAQQAMQIGLASLGMEKAKVSKENFVDLNISAEDIAEQLKAIGKKIMEFIDKLIDSAKQFASKVMAGLTTVREQAEALLEKLKNPSKRASTERANETVINIDSPAILWADGRFCIEDAKAETEVVKFFQTAWSSYAIDQIRRAKKMISEYDVESGNSENFKANSEFIGNHASLVNSITRQILPGNKQIKFKYVALGPELVEAEGAEEAPSTYPLEVRSSPAIANTLRMNIARMDALGNLFAVESNILSEMKLLSQAVMDLENRRGETVWKSARDDLDAITNMVMELINRLRPSYDPIVRHLAKVGTARNAVCSKELIALG